MKISRSYRLSEFLVWTRRRLHVVLALAIVPVRFLRLAASQESFESEDDRLDYRLEHHPEFLRRIAEAREALRGERGVRLEDLPS